ncbi:MAG TPA: antitoxin Xre/MbcA/ParS toxin-binding domain-containing protein [Longimicrobium sp.]|jgi:DNA-binding transcriptional regulator YdaS (Cro superfamily)
MSAAALLTGSRDEITEAAHDPRIEEAEAAILRFGRTGAVRDANLYARSCYSLVHEIVHQQFPRDVRREALQAAATKVLDAGVFVGLGPDEGWLAWSLAHELRDLAAAYGVPVESVRAPRPPREGGRGQGALSVGRLATLAHEVLRIAGSATALEEIQQVLGLSSAEAAALFGVSRQAVDQWRRNGVPAERVADVERVRDVAQVLYEELIPERIPQVVRNPARGLGGRSILDVLAEPAGAERVRAYLARLYSFEAA